MTIYTYAYDYLYKSTATQIEPAEYKHCRTTMHACIQSFDKLQDIYKAQDAQKQPNCDKVVNHTPVCIICRLVHMHVVYHVNAYIYISTPSTIFHIRNYVHYK